MIGNLPLIQDSARSKKMAPEGGPKRLKNLRIHGASAEFLDLLKMMFFMFFLNDL